MIFLLLLAMPSHHQKKNDAGPVGRIPAGPASFFKLRHLRRREAAEAKRENQKALPAAKGPLDGVERPHALWGCLFILVVDT